MLYDDLDGWEGSRWEGGPRKRGYLYTYKMIHFIVQQKLTQHCKAIIFKKKKKREKFIRISGLSDLKPHPIELVS